jgi:hypothetical protein
VNPWPHPEMGAGDPQGPAQELHRMVVVKQVVPVPQPEQFAFSVM